VRVGTSASRICSKTGKPNQYPGKPAPKNSFWAGSDCLNQPRQSKNLRAPRRLGFWASCEGLASHCASTRGNLKTLECGG
jgi:hypothetical protein